MRIIQHIIDQLQETDSAANRLKLLMSDDSQNEIYQINALAISKRREDLERRLSNELKSTQSDLVVYHVDRATDRYPALAVANAIARFQELVTAVFDAIRTTPKQRYRPSADNVELSTLDFAMALPVGSVVVSMSVENERLIAIQSDLDRTFENVFRILETRDSGQLREIASEVGIAAIAKAHDWAASAAEYGLNTKITIQKDIDNRRDFEISNTDALFLKETIEEKSDETIEFEIIIGELVGIDVDRPKTYFHLKTLDGRNLEGKLADTFPIDQEWAVHVVYVANVMMVTTVKYATGEERIEWLLANLAPSVTDTPVP